MRKAFDQARAHRSRVDVAERSRDGIAFTLTLLAAAALILASVLGLWFTEQEPNLDDLGLFNPVHTYLRTGDMSYPIYGMFETTIVHPPTHYLVLAWLMRLTSLSVEGAAILPILAWLVVTAVLVVSSRFSVSAKFAFLFAAFVGSVVWALPSFIRPDVHQATAWFAGLIALETGRLANWDWRRLGFGAALIGLSSALHYPASASIVAVGVYAVWAGISLGLRAARPAFVALAVGSGLVLVPYTALYLFPHWHEVTAFARLANARGGGGWLAGFDQTREQYRYLADTSAGGRFLGVLAGPFLQNGIPVVFVTTPLLAIRRETRGIALASAPYLLFLLFYARGKSGYYYTPEFLLYFASVAYAALLVLGTALSWIGISQRALVRTIALAGLAGVAAAVSLEPATLRAGGDRSWAPIHRDMEIARAAGSAMLPRNALVGTNDIGLWYITGGTRVHYFTTDVNPIQDLSQLNLRAYLNRFDAIAEARYDNWATFNRQREAIPDWYADGLLRVRGFYFGDRRSKPLTQMGYLLLSVRKTPIEGYAFRGRQVHHFRPVAGGTHVFSVAICGSDTPPATQYLVPWQLLTPLPGTTYPPTDSTRTIVSHLVSQARYRQTIRPLLRRSCDIRHEVSLQAETESVDDFLRRWRLRKGYDDVKVVQQVRAENALYAPPRAAVPLRNGVRLAPTPAPTARVIRKRLGFLQLATPSQQYAQVLTVPLPREARRRRWLKLHARVLEGRIGICVLDLEGQGCLLRRSLADDKPSGPAYLPVPPTNHRLVLYVDNDRQESSEFALDSIELITLARTRG
jgi:hypothetical protein